MQLDLQAVARALGGNVSGGQVLAPGPGHSAGDQSMSVKLDPNAPDRIIANSFSGDSVADCRDHVRSKLGLPAFKPNGRRAPKSSGDVEALLRRALATPPPAAKPVISYDYRDERGELLFQVVRTEPKSFRQRRPDGSGGWVWSLGDVRRVPYRLSEILKYEDATIFLCEGEKDADRAAQL